MLRRLLPILIAASALAVPAAASAQPEYHFGNLTSPDASSSPTQTLHKAQAALNGSGAADGRELTPLLQQLAAQLPRLGGTDRRRATRLLLRPTQGDAASNESSYTVPEHSPPLCSDHFCI